MFRARGVWCLLGALLAVLFAGLPPTAAVGGPPKAAGVTTTFARATALVPAAPVPAASSRPATTPRPAASVGSGQGPSCAPGGGDHGRIPAVPPRCGDPQHAAPAARVAAEQPAAWRTTPVRVLVRGPDRSTPGPVELSVLRV
ncbi:MULTISPECIES: hypothetical protein [unclassified Streptomyces]|uniref:hypothetical protein n=1 Tax=unclassified Streptomyces TaxID=2593676 RepID=UPI00226E2169|nr:MULTISPECIES: hypothetical protein [unclassified Streptomyces]MCY0922546.1 hypothetical protein [Streptomyces sp. H27-G5]MCY0962156.1 hypothetical protein [Streptomyces sp. H27-H5]